MSETVHTAIAMALVSGIVMAFVGVFFARDALMLMDTPADVIGQSALYMRIYFVGMPFFMLYNYGAAILRAVGDTKRPLLFLVISGTVNALLNLFLVIVFDMGVAGVAIATVISQLISCVLVLRCLCLTQSCYQLRFSELSIKKEYVKQILQVGLPAGIQSTVINFFQCTAAVIGQFLRIHSHGRIYGSQQYFWFLICFRQFRHAGMHELYEPESGSR